MGGMERGGYFLGLILLTLFNVRGVSTYIIVTNIGLGIGLLYYRYRKDL